MKTQSRKDATSIFTCCALTQYFYNPDAYFRFVDDKDSIKAFGEEVVTELCHQLLDAGAPGLHFYTMNQVGPTLALWKNLGL